MLQTSKIYRDLGGDYYTRQNPDRITSASSDSSKRSDTTSRSNPARLPPDGISLQQERCRGRFTT
jgi:hypothetical protein